MEHPCLIVRTDVDGGRHPLTIERQIIAAYPNIRLCGADCANDEQVIAAAQDADVIITNESYINRRVLQALPKLKGIVRYGIGYDRVDIAAAAQLGKVVANVPDFCFEEIGNHVLVHIGMDKKAASSQQHGAQRPMGHSPSAKSAHGQRLRAAARHRRFRKSRTSGGPQGKAAGYAGRRLFPPSFRTGSGGARGNQGIRAGTVSNFRFYFNKYFAQ